MFCQWAKDLLLFFLDLEASSFNYEWNKLFICLIVKSDLKGDKDTQQSTPNTICCFWVMNFDNYIQL